MTPREREPSRQIPSDTTFLLMDHKMELAYDFFIRNGGIFVTVSLVGIYDNPRWYYTTIPREMMPRLVWLMFSAPQMTRSLHPWYRRVMYPTDPNQTQVEFVTLPQPPEEIHGVDVEQIFDTLRKWTVKERNRVKALPEWLAADDRIDKRFGLGGKFEFQEEQRK